MAVGWKQLLGGPSFAQPSSPTPGMLWNVWVPVAVFEWSLPVGSTGPAQPVDPVGAPLCGINPSAFVIQER